jgi:DNA-binding MarR family transcriptional regulator
MLDEPAERPAPSLLYAVKRLELAIRARLDEMVRDAGITTAQYTALTVLAHREGVSAAQLARDSFVAPQSMGELLKLLEGRRLVRRAQNPQNRRENLVHLTDEGQQLLDRYAESERALEARMTDTLSSGDVAALRRFLATGYRALSN